LGIGGTQQKKYQFLDQTVGTFLLPSKLQGYKQRYQKADESNLITLNARKRKDKKGRGHLSKQVLRQLTPFEADPLNSSKLTASSKAALALRRFSVS
jgi:hypothetical protein